MEESSRAAYGWCGEERRVENGASELISLVLKGHEKQQRGELQAGDRLHGSEGEVWVLEVVLVCRAQEGWSKVTPVQQDGLVEHPGRDLSCSSAFRRRCCGSGTPRRHLWMHRPEMVAERGFYGILAMNFQHIILNLVKAQVYR